ncbi:hypothetical protein BDW59DRAFT_56992 [Aspergillus cavernicola]|uniref:Uncharacterized protein n=1 Tax=Aspergillus cavernicola TaxID=176166 RepID=A0ABR4IIG4_9EURO
MGDTKIQLINITELAHNWTSKKYTSGNSTPEAENLPVGGEEIRLQTLDIIENDALNTFQRMTLALPHIVKNITTLTLRSTSYPDFSWLGEGLFGEILPQLTNLETLNISIGEVFREETSLADLYTWLPANLTTPHFRGPISLCRSERWEERVTAFGSAEFLPNLQRLAFVLDLHYEKTTPDRKKLEDAPEELLQLARGACVNGLYSAARHRG